MSRSLEKLDTKITQLKSQMDAAREKGDEKAMQTISGFLNKSTRKREEAIKYSKIARENPQEDHKGKKKRRADEAIDQEVEEEKALDNLKLEIYDELVAKKDSAEPNGEIN